MTEAFYSEKAEKSILATLVTDRKASKYIGQLAADDFYPQNHKKLFAAMQAMYAEKKDIDLVTLSDRLKAMYGLEESALTEAIVEIATQHQFGSAWSVGGHIEIVKAAAMRRRMLEIVDGAKNELMDESNDTAVIVDKTRQALRDIVTTGHKWVNMSEVLIKTWEAIERRSSGDEPVMPSGINNMDAVTTGFHKGELTIIGARPSIGKSALGAHIALSTAEKNYRVGICSREMADIQYGSRILSRDSGIANNKLRTGNLDDNDWSLLLDALNYNSSLDVRFIFTTRYIEDLRAAVQEAVDTDGLDMLIVDYIQLMQTKQRFDKDYLRIAHVSKALKDMTQDLNIAIIALAQVGRASEGTMPTLAELRGSGDLEQDADNVIFIHRPIDPCDKYVHPADRELFGNLQQNGMQYIALNIAKQRQGETGFIPVIFNPARMRYTPIERSQAPNG